jgi:spermidine/putrescine-binding protein
MASRNLLQSYKLPEPILSKIPAERYGLRIYDPRYRWYGCWLTGFGIIYNRRVLALQGLRVPETWADLTDPSYFSWVGSADPRQSGSAHMAYEILLQAYGWEKGWEVITLMGANIKAFTRLSSDVPRDAALGEVACGLCIDTFAYSQMAFTGRDILGYVMPEGLTVLNPDGIGILKGAPQEAAAKKLIEFVMSEEGQRLIMLAPGRPGGPRRFGISRMSVHPDLYEQLGKDCSVPVNPFRMKSSLQFDTDKAARRYKLLDDMVGSLVIDNHALLQSAWAAVSRTKPPRREELARRLGRPPVDEGKAMDFAANAWSDTIARNRALLEWSRFAREKYEAVLRETR